MLLKLSSKFVLLHISYLQEASRLEKKKTKNLT